MSMEPSETRLSEKKYWDAKYGTSPLLRWRLRIKRSLNEGILRAFRRYYTYLLWDVIYPKYLPATPGLKVLEVGSAPGEHLVKMARIFGYVPFGVEYSEQGVEMNREVFCLNGLDPDNVLHYDFLSEEFQGQYKDTFDLVVSDGSIERFAGPKEVIRKHIDVLKDGGHLIVSIPNLRGMNYALTFLFNRRILGLHNLEIMDKRNFEALFDDQPLRLRFCDYFGTFNFGLFFAKRYSPLRIPLLFCHGLQLLFNGLFRLSLRDKGWESRFFSPCLMYIGVKKE